MMKEEEDDDDDPRGLRTLEGSLRKIKKAARGRDKETKERGQFLSSSS